MRGGFLAAKALFMIAILVFVTFSVSDLSQVSAVETGQNVCCEKTTSGDSCVYTDSGSCDASALQATTSCDQTAFCKTGCCISDEGKCSKSVSKSTCENTNGYSWQEGAACEVSACDKNCCVVGGSQCAYTTESNCEQLIEGLEDITLDWRAVDSESSCTSICNNADKGACMSDSGCTYGTQGDCAAPTIDYTSGNGFYKDTYCSDMGNSGCTAHADKKCVDEDVYNFDSCGNQEEKAVDCDYTKGTWCGADANGDLGCQSTDCLEPTFDGVYSVNGETTNRDTHDSKIGKTRKNGESWCLYESPAGGYFDRPGSQQYRAYCSFGKEYVEACKDFREQVCIQYPFTSFHDFSIFDSMDDWNKAGGDAYTSDIPSAGAACIDNGVYQDLINANVTTVPKGGDFWSGSTELADTCSTANLECPVTYARDTSMDSWHCVQNCYCLTQEWVDQAANYCATRGDCGAKYDLAGNYQGDTFYITRSQEALSVDNVTIGMTVVAYDQACDDEYYAQGATDVCPKRGTALNCYQKVDGTSEIDGSCSFENALSTAETQLLKNNYGVYGGMVGFSQSIGQYIAANYQILSTGALVGYIALASTIVGAVGLATFSIAAVVVGAGAGFAAGAAGVFGAASGITGALTGAAAGASTVPIAGWIVAAVLIIAAIISYVIISGGETTTVTISSNCQPWQPVQGVDNCDLCDKPVSEGGFALDDSKGNILPGYGCSEYKCRSLGSGCEYIQENEGTDRPTCFGTASNDVNHPVIQNAYLLDTYQDLSVSFAKDNNLIVNDKVAPYTFFSFGIETDELSQCKIQEGGSPEGLTYDSMGEFFPASYYDTVHNQSWILVPDTKYSFYIECSDHNGNAHNVPFVLQVETSAGDDITPPQILTTSIKNGGYVSAGATETPVTIFTDEPANCKWSSTDADYSLMENYFACSGIPTSASAYFTNGCTTALDISEGTNSYYFACEDAYGNSNTQNYPFTLQSTVPLLIDSSSPSGILYTKDVQLQVQTSAGAENGKAVCSYNGIPFFQTNASLHLQSLLDLGTGSYTYAIDCNDVAGNMNSTAIAFDIDVDISAPQLTALYKSGDKVYFSTDESSSCQYYYQDFSFGAGTSVSGSFDVTNVSTYYLACQDSFGNEGDWQIVV